jgi:site-specific DNA-methyltransferase (adenine-specific)
MRRLDTGTAARFFYCAKASKRDREEGLDDLPLKPGGMVSNTSGQHITRRDGNAPGPVRNHHPTVKPTALMRYLCRLVTPPGGTILDPFCGSGSTGKAAVLEWCNFIGIDLDAEYTAIAERRIAHVKQVAA